MIVQLSKWGNSLAVRIPAPALKEAGLGEGATAELSVEDGRIVLSPISLRRRYSLNDLVAGITRDNLHSDSDTGAPLGNEVW